MHPRTRSHRFGAFIAVLAVGFGGLFAASAWPTSAPGLGYWTAQHDGTVQAVGTAPSFGSVAGAHLWQPVVGMAATPTRQGYWLVSRDGGIFSFGDAHYYGSTGGIHLADAIVGIASTPTGHGYWLVARDGGIFAFG